MKTELQKWQLKSYFQYACHRLTATTNCKSNVWMAISETPPTDRTKAIHVVHRTKSLSALPLPLKTNYCFWKQKARQWMQWPAIVAHSYPTFLKLTREMNHVQLMTDQGNPQTSVKAEEGNDWGYDKLVNLKKASPKFHIWFYMIAVFHRIMHPNINQRIDMLCAHAQWVGSPLPLICAVKVDTNRFVKTQPTIVDLWSFIGMNHYYNWLQHNELALSRN